VILRGAIVALAEYRFHFPFSIFHFSFLIFHSQIQLGSAIDRCLKNTSWGSGNQASCEAGCLVCLPPVVVRRFNLEVQQIVVCAHLIVFMFVNGLENEIQTMAK